MNRGQRKSDGDVNRRIPHQTMQLNLNLSLRPAAREPDVERLLNKRTGRRKINVSINSSRFYPRFRAPFQVLFIELIAQHGDNFKRIASSMPNKVRHDVVS